MKVGLCLGGGGARGFAHIGVLKAMAERGIEPSAISGCSMGGLVGALLAAGVLPDEMRERFLSIEPVRILDQARGGGLIGHKGVDRQIEKHLPRNFDDLQVPLAVTAVDVQDGKLVVLRNGPLLPALRATSALPGLFTPVHHEGHVLIDGGLLNNLPVDVINILTLDPVIAVDVGAPPDRKLIFEDNRSFLEKFKVPTPEGHRPLIIELLMKTYDIPTALITDLRLAVHRPKVMIRPPLDPNMKVEDYKLLDEAIEIGYQSAAKALDEAWPEIANSS